MQPDRTNSSDINCHFSTILPCHAVWMEHYVGQQQLCYIERVCVCVCVSVRVCLCVDSAARHSHVSASLVSKWAKPRGSEPKNHHHHHLLCLFSIRAFSPFAAASTAGSTQRSLKGTLRSGSIGATRSRDAPLWPQAASNFSPVLVESGQREVAYICQLVVPWPAFTVTGERRAAFETSSTES